MEPEHRSPLRILAPAAVVAFGLALVLVIATTSGSGGGGNPQSSKLERQDLGAKKRAARRASGRLPQGTYIVKRNDTLGAIADKTGIPVDTLMTLNPDLDPQTLHEGQKIKLR
jgi:LysM repeat protein